MFSVFGTDEMDSKEVRRLTEHYFHHGFQHQVVVDFLNNRQAITIGPFIRGKIRRVLHRTCLKEDANFPYKRHISSKI